MPWGDIALNDGYSIPAVAFGTWRRMKSPTPEEEVTKIKTGLDVGFTHIDTAQGYQNEVETGRAIKESGIPREKLFITTKWSGKAGLEESIASSLSNLGVSYVDLYLIHEPRFVQESGVRAVWERMEKIKDLGLLEHAKYPPAAVQIMINPYTMPCMKPIIAVCKEHNITVEGYCPNTPMTAFPDKPVRPLVESIAAREGTAPETVCLAWVRLKGFVVVTSSTKRERMENYLKAGDLVLSDEDMSAIDRAGESAPLQWPPS